MARNNMYDLTNYDENFDYIHSNSYMYRTKDGKRQELKKLCTNLSKRKLSSHLKNLLFQQPPKTSGKIDQKSPPPLRASVGALTFESDSDSSIDMYSTHHQAGRRYKVNTYLQSIFDDPDEFLNSKMRLQENKLTKDFCRQLHSHRSPYSSTSSKRTDKKRSSHWQKEYGGLGTDENGLVRKQSLEMKAHDHGYAKITPEGKKRANLHRRQRTVGSSFPKQHTFIEKHSRQGADQTDDRHVKRPVIGSRQGADQTVDRHVKRPVIGRYFSMSSMLVPYKIGFPNPSGSNSCWVNSSLQVLLSMRPLMDGLKEAAHDPIVANFMAVVRSRDEGLWSPLRDALRQLKNSLGQLDPNFAGSNQQDAPEFLALLLDHFRMAFQEAQVHRRISLAERLSLRDHLALDNDSISALLDPEVTDEDRLNINPVQDNIVFCLQETYTCTSCRLKICKTQEHTILFVDVPSPDMFEHPTLQDAMVLAMQAGSLEMPCSRCKGTYFTFSATFKHLPRILILQLKRYSVASIHKNTQKLVDTVHISRRLSMANLVEQGVTLPKQQDNQESSSCVHLTPPISTEDKPSNTMGRAEVQDTPLQSLQGKMEDNRSIYYRLTGIVSHYGNSLKAGHYVADVYQEEEHSWFHYDDESVTKQTEMQVLTQLAKKNGYLFTFHYDGYGK